jgi:glycosyltransferase involved in cell wall biosynthesis
MNAGPVVFDARAASPHFPGIGRSVIGLAGALAAGPGVPRVTLLHAADPDARLPLAALRGTVCRSTPFDVRQQWEVRGHLRRTRAAVYHSPYFLMPYAPGVPAIVTCHDLIPLTVPRLFGAAKRFAFRLGHRLAFRTAQLIIVPSVATRDDVRRLFPSHAGKIEVVPHGWDFTPDTRKGSPGSARPLGVPGRFVLAVGSNRPHKNLRVLVEAWSQTIGRLGDDDSAPRLVFAGPRDGRFDEGGPRADELRRAGHLISLGPVSDEALAALYAEALLLVCPSRAEGFGLPVLEAMGRGTPVACSRVPALEESSDGAAALFDPDDPAALARLLEHLLASPAERDAMSEAGLKRAAGFSWSHTASLTSALYARVIGGLR